MAIATVFIQGLFELLGLGGFIAGYLADIKWLMILGGCLLVLDDVIEIGMGTLHPLFPILLALALAIIISPWYVGIFWGSAAFQILGIPTSIMKIFAPRLFLERAAQRLL